MAAQQPIPLNLANYSLVSQAITLLQYYEDEQYSYEWSKTKPTTNRTVFLQC